MKIRARIILVFLPLLIAPLLLSGLGAVLAARNGLTRVATAFLLFKSEQLRDYAETQWKLLQDNGLDREPEFVDAAGAAVASFARSLIRSDTELILALDETGAPVMQTGEAAVRDDEAGRLVELASYRAPGGPAAGGPAAAGGAPAGDVPSAEGWQRLRIGGVERVAQVFAFPPFGWTFIVSEERSSFYGAVREIVWQSSTLTLAALAVSVLLVLLLSRYLTGPLKALAGAMRGIIESSDLSRRVDILYPDETGELGHSFNLMTSELERAYSQVKGHALRAAVAQRKEQKIRTIFQKYVPQEVIEQYFTAPESMLVGEDRELAILFSDIRGFTGIAELMKPNEVVESLNRYFGLMVDVIMSRRGVVDKYIGDAIMAFFGAPVKHSDDAFQAVRSAFEMLQALERFNEWQVRKGRRSFRVGIGIDYGTVTLGNIGSEKKMDYTVIGDRVNLASRLEGLTKKYGVPVIVSESIYRHIMKEYPCRLLDRVEVKGRAQGVAVYAPRESLAEEEKKAWKYHHAALQAYYNREFERAARFFLYVRKILPDDRISKIFLERCRSYMKSPPPSEWKGIVPLTEK